MWLSVCSVVCIWSSWSHPIISCFYIYIYDLWKFGFTNRVVNTWNSLPNWVVSANTATNICWNGSSPVDWWTTWRPPTSCHRCSPAFAQVIRLRPPFYVYFLTSCRLLTVEILLHWCFWICQQHSTRSTMKYLSRACSQLTAYTAPSYNGSGRIYSAEPSMFAAA